VIFKCQKRKKVERKEGKDSKMKLKFVDLKRKKVFFTEDYELVKTKKGRRMAVAIAPSGVKSVRFVKKDFKK